MIASQIEQGRGLEEILESRGRHFPRHFSGLIRAAARTGNLGAALDTLLEQHRASLDMRREVIASLTYPTLVLGCALAVFVFLSVVVVTPFREMFEEFDLVLPRVTQQLIMWSQTGLWLAIGFASTSVVLAVVVRFAVGPAVWRHLISALPLVGPLWHWPGVSQWARLLGALVDQGVPLPEALQLTAEGMRDANVAQASRLSAADVAAGRPLSDVIASTARLPASLVPLVRWGEKTGQLPEALSVAAEVFSERVRMLAAVVKSVLPPSVFLVILGVVGWMVVGLFMPLVDLIQGLSG
jgi:type IV pilus assembly protein PilC